MDEKEEMTELFDRLSFVQDYGFTLEVQRLPEADYEGRSYKAKIVEGRQDGMIIEFECQIREDKFEFLYWEDQFETIDYENIWRFICFRTMNALSDLKYETRKKDARTENRIKIAEINGAQTELERLKAAKYRKIGPDRWEWINQEIRIYYEARKTELSKTSV